MFQTNEYVVFGRYGVCLVEGIEQIDGRDYYCLRTLYQNCLIKTPLSGKTPVRKVISKEQADRLIDMIPTIKAKPLNCSHTKELNEKYRSSASSQDCRDLIELIMSIYAKKQELQKARKKLSSADEAYWKEGEGRFFGELSIALGIPYDEVQSYIHSRLSGQQEAESVD